MKVPYRSCSFEVCGLGAGRTDHSPRIVTALSRFRDSAAWGKVAVTYPAPYGRREHLGDTWSGCGAMLGGLGIRLWLRRLEDVDRRLARAQQQLVEREARGLSDRVQRLVTRWRSRRWKR